MAETKKAPNQIVKLALVLFLVSAIVSGVLGVVNMFTKDRIAELEAQARAEAYNAVLPWDGEYVNVEYDKDTFETVDAIAQAGDQGWVVELTFSGAQSSISAAFGRVAGLHDNGRERYIPLRDFWPRREDRGGGFLASFVGQSEGMAVTKDGGTVDSITAATISSRAMANAANTAIAAVKALG